ncbi:tetratricopeptide repeat protein [Massilia sp. TN1-12]|uniref:tetratricopeptide repeat protein n=1 Tax=Massilia paldalensis TaxID=3377675 RepID=UPI00384B5C88
MDDPGALLRQAVQLHQQGRLDAAATLYRRVLDAAPRQFDALHLLGVIERQRGNPARAAELIGAALQVDPGQARAHCNLGAALQDLDRPADALASYDAALRLDPRYALAWNNRGNALRRLGRQGEALDSYERALAIQAGYPEAWCQRAMLLNDLGRFEEAAASAEQASSRRPGYADALLALGNALQGMDLPADAVRAYDAALAAAPRQADAWCARGAALKKSGDLAAALDSYDRALALRPDYALAAHYRANALRALGRRDDARAAYHQALALGADGNDIAFALAALGEGALPDAAPRDYVRELFDGYAGRFERHLVGQLGYRTPALLAALLSRHGVAPAPGAAWHVADLGCGTGLCAPFLRPLAARLTGVDLSPKMLERAAQTGSYDALACAEIGDWLAGQEHDCDLLVAADVLVYIGALDTLFARAHAALGPGGRFAFSCEALEGADGYAITASNRFAHALAYVQRCAAQAGFVLVEAERAVLRREHGEDVQGWVVLLAA